MTYRGIKACILLLGVASAIPWKLSSYASHVVDSMPEKDKDGKKIDYDCDMIFVGASEKLYGGG
jgi:hypothetical protein